MSAPPPKEIVGYQFWFRNLGYYLTRPETYQQALSFFDTAIQKVPDDPIAIFGRSLPRAKVHKYVEALDDIKKALSIDNDNLVMLAQQALVKYLSCEFEEGALLNVRMVPVRKKPENFTMGVRHCKDAIENCMGDRAGRPLRDHFKIIRRLAWKKNFEKQKPYVPVSKYFKKKKVQEKDKGGFVVGGKSLKNRPPKEKPKETSVVEARDSQARPSQPRASQARPSQGRASQGRASQGRASKARSSSTAPAKPLIDPGDEESIVDSLYTHKASKQVIPPGSPFPFRPMQECTSNIDKYMAEKYLGRMCLDKTFYQEMEFDPGMECPNEEGMKKIHKLAKTGYKIINYNQELLRARRPFYMIKYQEDVKVSPLLKNRQMHALYKVQAEAKSKAIKITETMKRALADGRIRLLQEMCEKLRRYCEVTSKKLLPERDVFLEAMFDMACEGYFRMNHLPTKKKPEAQETRVSILFGIPLKRIPSKESLLEQFKGVFIDWKKMVYLYVERLDRARTMEEMLWLYYEIARFKFELKEYEMSRVYARKCLTEANILGEIRWVVNCTILLIKINIVQHNKNDAQMEVSSAIIMARRMRDKNLVEFFRMTLKLLDKAQFEEAQQGQSLHARIKKMIDIMPDNRKSEATHLFNSIMAMPPCKRMLLMPGVQYEDLEPQKTPEQLAAIKLKKQQWRKNLKKVESKDKGALFLELIQFHID